MEDELVTATKLEKPPASDTFLFAAVMAVAWACVATLIWALLALGFGRSRDNGRLITMLVLGAVVTAFLCGHAYRQGWKSRRR